jgi:Flp pilus assembly pilin Flp
MFASGVLRVRRAVTREDGQAMAEYGIIMALIAAVVISVLVVFGGQVTNLFNSVVSAF